MIHGNNRAGTEHGADMQSTYEELEDTSYDEISPSYMGLVTSKQNNSSGKYINVQKNQGNNIRKVCFQTFKQLVKFIIFYE